MLGALAEITTAFADLNEIEQSEWLGAHSKAENVQLFLHYAYPGITILACFFMFRAKNWARWMYLICNALHYGTSLALLVDDYLADEFVFLKFDAEIFLGMTFYFIALAVLSSRGARVYFAAGGRPWWQREMEG